MKVAFDLHGVVMVVNHLIRRYYKEDLGINIDKETNKWNFDWPESYDMRRCGIDIANAIKKYGPTTHAAYGSLPALKQWRDRGNKIQFVTASADSVMPVNIAWLDKHLGQPYSISNVSMTGSKSATLKQMGVTHFVDDRFKTCRILSKILDQVYLFNAPYNIGRETAPNVMRVNTLRQMFNHMEK